MIPEITSVSFFQQLVNALSLGSIYALLAVGYNLVYGILGLINFAHGDALMFGTFVVLAAMTAGVPFGLAIVIGLVAAAVIAALVDQVTSRPMRGAKSTLGSTVSAIGFALVLQNVAQLIWGPDTRPFHNPLPSGSISVGGVYIPYLSFVIVAVAGACAAGLYLFAYHTSYGRWMRAIRDDAATAQLMGIKVNSVVMVAYVVGGVLGLLGGVLFAAYYNTVYIGMGFTGTLNAFVAAVIGGIGSMSGAFVGGIALGLLQTFAITYISSGYTNTVTFGALILLLLIRPYGLFGKATVERA